MHWIRNILSAVLIGTMGGAYAQEEDAAPAWWRHIRPAAEVSLSVGGSSSYIFVAPFGLYRLLPRLEAGGGFELWYYWLNFYGTLYSGSIYGPFTKIHWQPFESIPGFLAYHEEWLWVPLDSYNPSAGRGVSHNLMFGAGYKNYFRGARQGYSYLSVLINVTHNPLSPYSTPLVVRFGAVF